MATFAIRTDEHPGVFLNKESLDLCCKGLQKRIRREKNGMAKSTDKLYREKRKDNIHRLKIIKSELQSLIALI